MGGGTIVFLVSHATPGGVQELWSDLADGFQGAGHHVMQVALYPLHERDAGTEKGRWTYLVSERPTGVFSGIKLMLALTRFFRQVRPAMVFSAMPAANVAAPIAASLSLRRIPVSTSHHSPTTTYSRVLNFVDGFTGALTRTHAVVCVGKTVAHSLNRKSNLYRSKVRIIPNALSPQNEQNLAELYRSRLAHSAGTRRVVAVGRLSEQKNYLTLIRCAPYLRDMEIVIAGGGPDETILKAEVARLGVSAQVRFAGPLARAETFTLLRTADAFVQPSLFEGHSLALIEAAKLGLPLVVSDAASQVEAITHAGRLCGIVVGLYDHVALAGALQRLVDDARYREQWAQEAYVLGKHSTFAGMLDSYRNLVPS